MKTYPIFQLLPFVIFCHQHSQIFKSVITSAISFHYHKNLFRLYYIIHSYNEQTHSAGDGHAYIALVYPLCTKMPGFLFGHMSTLKNNLLFILPSVLKYLISFDLKNDNRWNVSINHINSKFIINTCRIKSDQLTIPQFRTRWVCIFVQSYHTLFFIGWL
jgi:hypothetical protein